MLEFLFSPSGRLGRGGWWLGQLVIIVTLVMGVVILASQGEAPSALPVIMAILLFLAVVWFNICITIKRYHDRDKSGWWFFFQFIPIIGPIWTLIELGFCSGTYGDNDYGPGPGLNIKDDLAVMLKDSEYSESYSTAQRMKQSTPSSYQPPKSTYSGGGATFGKRG
jgi:uncharacterized membrane protein YhaH (DUF805 family)